MLMNRKMMFKRVIPIVVVVGVFLFECITLIYFTTHPFKQTTLRKSFMYVAVDEIYQRPENVQQLYDLLGNGAGTTAEQIYALAAKTLNAKQIHQNTYGKNADQDVQVKFGGLTWQVCFLSLTGTEQDADRTPILTLVLSEGFVSGRWHLWDSGDYNTSYARAVTINNGGGYQASADQTTLTTAIPDANHLLARFTMPNVEHSLTDLIVKPRAVAWQKSKSNYGNEYWDDGDVWQDDYLWLPSATEMGLGNEFSGDWQLCRNQRRAAHSYWLRSGIPSAGVIYYIDALSGIFEQTTMATDDSHYFRPALHLNLTALQNA